MFGRKKKNRFHAASVLEIVGLLLLRVSRGLSIDDAVASLKRLKYSQELFSEFQKIMNKETITRKEFRENWDEDSDFLLALIEVLRQIRKLPTDTAADALVFLKADFEYKMFAGESITNYIFTEITPEEYAAQVLRRLPM